MVKRNELGGKEIARRTRRSRIGKTNKGIKYRQWQTLLNQKQELYCVNIVKGMSQEQAGLGAGYRPGTCRTLQRMPAIHERIKELRNKVAKKEIAEVEERKKKLTEVVRKELPERGLARDRIAAIAELNKMEGTYAPEKQVVEKVYSFVFIMPDGTKTRPEQLVVQHAPRVVEGEIVSRSD